MNIVPGYGQILWVVGSPIGHTLSPVIHNAAFESESLPHRYFAMEVSVDELGEFLDVFQAVEALGDNFTLPLKENIRNWVETESEAVTATGAANTLYREDGQLCLDNTDVYGFTELVASWHSSIECEPVLVLGAGGAARACLYALQQLGCPRVLVWNRTTKKAELLRDEFSELEVRCLSDHELEKGNYEVVIVVNATSLGLQAGDPSPLPVDGITSEMVGVDLIYHRETRFMSDFYQYGKYAVGGLKMLVCQAAKAWEHWIGSQPKLEIMMNAARDELCG